MCGYKYGEDDNESPAGCNQILIKMANQVETVVASAPIKSPADKFYNFFKFNMSDIVKIFPAAFTEAQLIQGEEGAVGSVKLWKYIIGKRGMCVCVSFLFLIYLYIYIECMQEGFR